MTIKIGARERRAWRCFKKMLELFESESESRNQLFEERKAMAHRLVNAEHQVAVLSQENARLYKQLRELKQKAS